MSKIVSVFTSRAIRSSFSMLLRRSVYLCKALLSEIQNMNRVNRKEIDAGPYWYCTPCWALNYSTRSEVPFNIRTDVLTTMGGAIPSSYQYGYTAWRPHKRSLVLVFRKGDDEVINISPLTDQNNFPFSTFFFSKNFTLQRWFLLLQAFLQDET